MAAMELISPSFVEVQPPADGWLRARALRPLSEPEVTEVCELLLAHAHATNCCWWLIDVRLDPGQKSMELNQWMWEEFLPRAAAELGQPVYLAYIMGADHLARLRAQEPTGDAILRAILLSARVRFFAAETDALAWLSQRQPTP